MGLKLDPTGLTCRPPILMRNWRPLTLSALMSIKVDPRGWVWMSTKVDNKGQCCDVTYVSTMVNSLTEMTYCYFYHIFSTEKK